MHRIRAITLDLDDTLWEIGPVIRRAEEQLWGWLCENFPRIPQTYSPQDMLTLRQQMVDQHRQHAHDFRYLRKKVLEKVALESGYSADLVDPAFAVFDAARNAVTFYPDVLPALEAIAERFTLIAVTNGNANLQSIGIRHLFADVVTAVDAGAPKPAPAIFCEAVKRAGVSPIEVLHVGDHPEIDIAGAQQAGLRTAWMNRNGYAWPQHLPAPDAEVATVTALRELLQPACATHGSDT